MSSDRAALAADLVFEDTRIKISGVVDRQSVAALDRKLPRRRGRHTMELDLTAVRDLDAAGMAWLLLLEERLGIATTDPPFHGLPTELHSRWLEFAPSLAAAASATNDAAKQPPSPSPAERGADALAALGSAGLAWSEAILEALVLAANIFYFSGLALVGRGRSRRGAVRSAAVSMGVDALGVVLLIAFLVGLVMALQSAAQLRRFGANIFVADLIGIAMAREMGALMTAIVLAGRSGSAVAAEIATMVVTEETDALRSLGLHPVRFVVVPRFLAMSVVTPLLSLLAIMVGIIGGLLAAVFYLDLAPRAFLVELLTAVTTWDLVTSLAKSVVFAWLITLLGSFHGFRARGGAQAVGRATTSAVVSSIFAVIVADAIAGLLFYLD
jgi:phospholipid/cholesterol/gamma-HCH transport system permease protein